MKRLGIYLPEVGVTRFVACCLTREPQPYWMPTIDEGVTTLKLIDEMRDHPERFEYFILPD